ncbi:hypothetical protein JRI60_49735 [Archangium violaceum]|uniref:DUF6748 domain-containing protein n=1 Tax=Archangium violaceum TaxID=83451 RepID=UPI00195042A9|nr:DUF6748 domain-containing protein [Archangium violaceum]QRN96965.1 hypothetical protein JRI60_49735 [Archangium violaceum]
MTLRQPLVAAALAFSLLVGCSRNTPESRPAESGGTPTERATPSTNPTGEPPPSEPPSGGTAAAANAGTPVVYIVKDSGVRCMAAPCPTFIATRADRPNEDGLQITDVDLAALGFNAERSASLMEATHTPTGLKVEATVVTVPKAGPAGDATVLRVTRVIE